MLEKSYGAICDHYTKDTCAFGISGKGCESYHPKMCRRFVKFGSHGKRGCSKGTSCLYFHPKLCNKSLKPISQRVCTNQSCRYFHLPRTKRHQSYEKRGQTSTSFRQPNSRYTDRISRKENPHNVEQDPFLGNLIRNLVKESLQVELASFQNLAPKVTQAPPFLPGMSHFTQPWNQAVPPVRSSQQMHGPPLTQGQNHWAP